MYNTVEIVLALVIGGESKPLTRVWGCEMSSMHRTSAALAALGLGFHSCGNFFLREEFLITQEDLKLPHDYDTVLIWLVGALSPATFFPFATDRCSQYDVTPL